MSHPYDHNTYRATIVRHNAGVTDASTDIQAAIDVAMAAGSVVVIPPGTYRITTTLLIPSRVAVSGDRIHREVGIDTEALE